MKASRLLAVVAVEAEARVLGERPEVEVVVGGIGRTNAAAATTEALIELGPFHAVCSVGIAGTLPGGGAGIGDLVLGREAVYLEEGIETPEGFADMRGLGFPLGDFEGNRVPADRDLLEALLRAFERGTDVVAGPIATVATCSGTDRRASEVAARTGAVAEAMEGAAVLHAARRRGVPAVEVRAISNTTGDRPSQRWDPPAAFASLESAWPRVVAALRPKA